MKRFIPSSRIFAFAALLLGAATGAAAETASGNVPRAVPNAAVPERPGAPAAWAPKRPGQARSASAQASHAALVERRQKFLAAARAAGLGKTGAAKPVAMDAAPASAVKFPGFLQGEVVTRGTPASDATNALAVVTMDVNHDGLADVVNVQVDGTVTVLLNPGGDKLDMLAVSSVNTSAGAARQIRYATSADLNGDGYPELVALDYNSNSVVVFPNKKDGTFGAATVAPVAFSSGTSLLNGGGMAIGDFNGDGAPDVAVYVMTPGYGADDSTESSHELVVLPGKGDGTFATQLEEQYTLLHSYGTTMPGQVDVADVNHDGNLDIVMMAGGFDDSGVYEEVYVITMLGDGTGKFTRPPVNLPLNGAIAPGIADGAVVGGMKLADLDGDGNLDVLFANCENQNLYESMGNGDGTFRDATQPITTFGYPGALSFADVTGDGKIDVIEYGNGYTAVFPGLGKGKFAQTPTLMDGSLAGFVPGQPADFDGDGQLDIVRTDVVTGYTSLFVEKNGVFNASPVLGMPNSTAGFFQAVAKGDFNGDGTMDVVAIDYTVYWSNTQTHYPYPDIVVGLNDGKGNFTYKVALDHDTLYAMNAGDSDSGLLLPQTADFNGDGMADLLVNGENGLYIALATGAGTFATPQPVPLSPVPACAISRVDIGDLNGDGKKDMALAYPGDSSCSGGSTPSGVYGLLSNGDGTFATKFTALGASAYLPRLIDFNGDGVPDLALADDNSDEFAFDFLVVPGNGDGTFNANAATHPLVAGTAVTSIAVGDFNKDGKQDLTVGTLFRNFTPGTTGLITLAGNGNFTFGEPTLYAIGSYPYDLEYADFNGDGYPDLAMNVGWNFFLAGPFMSNFGHMVNQGDGTFGDFQSSVATTFDLGGFFYGGDYNSFASLLVDDFNGDGAPDALSALAYDESYHLSSPLFLNAGGVQFALKAAATQVDQGTPLTVTATVTHSVGKKTPTGTVQFFDNGTLVDTEQVADGVAMYTDSDPAVGAHALTASYSGDANFNAATGGAAVNVAVDALAPAFTLAKPAPSILSVVQGTSGSVTLALASNATFSGTISLSCAGAPAQATCEIAPATVTLTGGQTATATLKLTTTGTTVTVNRTALPAAATFAALLVLLMPGRMRRARRLWLAVALVVLTGVTLSATGCGSGSHKTQPGTPAGQSTLTITATAGTLTQTQTITLNVQ